MSIRQNGNVIAGLYGVNTPLLHPIWSDRILNDASWLRADTYSWQSGDLYIAAYEHLLDDWNNGTLVTETVGNHTFSVKVAEDGHKMFSTSGHDLAQELYDTYGVSWYYIVDTANKRFKLPRTKFGFTGIRTSVGEYVKPGLPNITGQFYGQNAAITGGSGAFATGNNPWGAKVAAGTENNQMTFSASRSNSIYGQSDTVQPAGTQMYLYFFVGNYDQNQYKLDTGRITELVNDFDIVETTAEVNAVKAEAVNTINSTRDSATASIENTKNTSISNINATQTAAETEINNTMSDAISNVKSAEQASIDEIGNIYPTIADYPYTITNCIKTIPQDITLELGDSLVVKSGSKCYRPNGSGVFNIVPIDSDIKVSVPSSAANGKVVLFLRTDNSVWVENIENITSGETEPARGTFYNTSTNTIDWYDASGVKNVRTYSLPLGVCTVSGGAIVNIDRVFNGFGYVGSTVFALPGINYLIPDGRTSDGLIKNKNITTTKVSISTTKYKGNQIFSLGSNGTIVIDYIPTNKNSMYYVNTRGEMYDLGVTNGWNKCYVKEDNQWYQTNDDSSWVLSYCCPVITTQADENLKITTFDVKTTLHHEDSAELVHRNGNETISGVKTFEPLQADGRLVFKLNDITIGQTPSVNHFGGYKCVDSQGVEFGNCNSSYNTAGRVGTNFYVQREMSDGQTKSASLGVYIDADGTTYAQAPTTNVSDNTGNIATTKFVHDIFAAIYPVGSIYIGTQASCPMAIAIPGSTWSLVSSGKALWTGTGSNGNSTIAAGLPNITGDFGSVPYITKYNTNDPQMYANGSMGIVDRAALNNEYSHVTSSQGSNRKVYGYTLDASRSSSIYGKSSTVQPPAYVVNVWRRTA